MPPKRKIIEDSDEEGDIESPTKETKTGNEHVAVEIEGDNIPPAPVKLRLNDTVEDGNDTTGHAFAQRDAARAYSMSQPNVPAISKPTSTKGRRAKTLADVVLSETSTASLESSKGTKSFDSNDIFEFQGEDGEDSGPKKKRRRTQSQAEDRVQHRSLQTPRDALKIHGFGTQSSTIPTIADTSPFQVPSMSSYLNDGELETIQTDKTLDTEDAVPTAELFKDSFEDELAAAYPPSVVRASVRPMVLVPEHYADNEMTDDRDVEHHEASARSASKTKQNADSRREVHSFADELGSDDQDIGIPKDQYKPRPSRSRGRRQNREDDLVVPTDFSKRPEAASKAKKKSKSAGSSDVKAKTREEIDEPSLLEETSIVQPAELKRDEKAQLNEQRGEDKDGDQSMEVTAQDSHDAAMPSKPVKKQRGRPRKNVESIAIDGGAQEIKSAEVQNVATAAEPTRSAKKEVRIKKSSSIVNSDSETDSPDPESKVGDRLEQDEETKIRPLQELDANSPRKRGRPFQTQQPAEDDLPKPETPEKKSAAPTPKGPAKHSPISKTGAARFRVGLSKNARIAPLLSIVRK